MVCLNGDEAANRVLVTRTTGRRKGRLPVGKEVRRLSFRKDTLVKKKTQDPRNKKNTDISLMAINFQKEERKRKKVTRAIEINLERGVNKNPFGKSPGWLYIKYGSKKNTREKKRD